MERRYRRRIWYLWCTVCERALVAGAIYLLVDCVGQDRRFPVTMVAGNILQGAKWGEDEVVKYSLERVQNGLKERTYLKQDDLSSEIINIY